MFSQRLYLQHIQRQPTNFSFPCVLLMTKTQSPDFSLCMYKDLVKMHVTPLKKKNILILLLLTISENPTKSLGLNCNYFCLKFVNSLICINLLDVRCSVWQDGLQPHHTSLISSWECLTFSFPFHPSTLPLPSRCSCSPCTGHMRWDSACLPLAV